MVLTEAADVTGDPSLSLRLAAVAAEKNLPIARDALNLLGRKAPPPPRPWPDELRATLVRVLATGPPAIAALEAIDQRHLLERYLPEWTAVRNKPQRNPYHRFTVDRHLLEATANAATLAHRVSRVDLLLLGTLLHDIGKGFAGDHTEVGMRVVADIGTRIGLPPADVDTLVTLVRLHLLLPDTATRRDLDDPATAERVAKEVGNRSTLDLLAALVEADSLATGPSAWGSWKAGLVAELVERASRLLAGEPATPPTPWITDDLRVIMDTVRDHGVPALSIDDPTVTVVAADRPGLFAEVTGVLALHGLNVRSAVVAGEDGVAVEIFTVEPSRGRWPAAARLADDLAGVMDGSLSIESQLAERARTYRNERRAITPHLVSTQVERGQQRLGHGLGRRGEGRGRGRTAPPDHTGPGGLPSRRQLGQGLHLRLGGRRRLLRPRSGRGEADRPATDRGGRRGHPPPDRVEHSRSGHRLRPAVRSSAGHRSDAVNAPWAGRFPEGEPCRPITHTRNRAQHLQPGRADGCCRWP